MQLHKTEKARAALQRRTGMLSMQERRILILSDGQRSLDDIAGLLGATARPVALRLVEEHYLASSAMAAARIPAMHAAVAVPAPVATRRSIASTRMYMLDMLQLQRGPEAATIRARLQASVGRESVLAVVLQGLQHIQCVTAVSYGQRVFDRVEEMIPEEALPLLRARCAAALRTAD